LGEGVETHIIAKEEAEDADDEHNEGYDLEKPTEHFHGLDIVVFGGNEPDEGDN